MHVVLKLTEIVYWVVFILTALMLLWAAILGLKTGGNDDQTTEGHSTESDTQD